jgi:hypothetical protein
MKTLTKKTTASKIQTKLSEFLNGTKISQGLKLAEGSKKVLSSIKTFKGHEETKDALSDRERKLVRPASSYKGMSYEAFFNSLKAKGELKDGKIVDVRLVSYIDGELIGGCSSTGDEVLQEKFGFKMKKLFDGLNKGGIKVYLSLKTEKQKTDFLKSPKLEHMTSSKKGIVRFNKI